MLAAAIELLRRDPPGRQLLLAGLAMGRPLLKIGQRQPPGMAQIVEFDHPLGL